MSARLARLFVAVVSVFLVPLSANAVTTTPPFVYALRQVDGGANQIYGFRLDRTTGELTALPGFPVATGGTGGPFGLGGVSEQLVFGGGRLFAVNEGSDTLSVFAVNQATGALIPLPFSPIALGSGNWPAVGVHPTGSPILVGSSAGFLASFMITPTTAAAAPGSPFVSEAGARQFSIVFSSDGNHVYAGGDGGTGIAGFSVTPSTGVLTALPGSPFDSGDHAPVAYATDKAGRLFIAHDSGHVRVFTSSAGVPAGVPGNPFPSPLTGIVQHGALHPAGFYLVADAHRGIGVYRISGSGAGTRLAAVSGSPFFVGVNSLALTPEGSLLVALKGSRRDLSVFQVDSATGTLTALFLQHSNTLGSSGAITGMALVPALTEGDFNGDRNADLLWRNTVSGHNIGWLMNGTAVSSAAFLPTIGDTNWEVKGTGDFDANGRADLIWRHKVSGQNVVWLMDGLVVSLSAFLPRIADTNWEIRGVGDFDGHGHADVIWRHAITGQNMFWLMNGASVAAWVTLPTVAAPNWDVKGIGDADGNGRADVIWRNRVTGHNLLWLMNGLAPVVQVGLKTVADTDWEIEGVGDLNGDGLAAVVWRNTVTGQNIATVMNWTTGFSSILPTIADTNWKVNALRDVDGDGKSDVIWRHSVTGETLMWLMNGSRVTLSESLPFMPLSWEIVGQ